MNPNNRDMDVIVLPDSRAGRIRFWFYYLSEPLLMGAADAAARADRTGAAARLNGWADECRIRAQEWSF